jgi:hypothetical protein
VEWAASAGAPAADGDGRTENPAGVASGVGGAAQLLRGPGEEDRNGGATAGPCAAAAESGAWARRRPPPARHAQRRHCWRAEWER